MNCIALGLVAGIKAGMICGAIDAAPPAADLPLRVIDGDTVEAGGVGYRLPGVDAAEMDSRCGPKGCDEADRPRWCGEGK